MNCRAAAREGSLGCHGSNHPPAGENSARSHKLIAEFQGGVAFCNASLHCDCRKSSCKGHNHQTQSITKFCIKHSFFHKTTSKKELSVFDKETPKAPDERIITQILTQININRLFLCTVILLADIFYSANTLGTAVFHGACKFSF